MGRKTVLHLIDTGGPGGAETIFLNVVAGLDAARWRSIAAVPVVDWLHGALAARGIEPVLLPSHGAFDIGYLGRIIGLIRRHKVDLVQAHLLTTSVYASLAGRLIGVPVVCTFHGAADVPAGERYRRLKFRIIDSRTSHVVFVSESLRRRFLQGTLLRAGRTSVIRNGVDMSAFRPGQRGALRAELGIGPEEILVGAIGNVRPSKDYPNLLEAAALLRRRSPAYRFVIVGQAKGPLFEELLALRTRLGLERCVEFAGFREDVATLIPDLDVYVCSSSSEGFSLTTVQAMGCGVPVAATRCGGPEEIVEHEETGLLVDPGSPAALAAAIHRLVSEQRLRERLAQAARRAVARRFTVEGMVGAYAALYERRLGLARRPVAPGEPMAER